MNTSNVVKLAKKIISIPTITGDQAPIAEAFEVIKKELSPSIKTKSMINEGAEILWATNSDFSSPQILLMCHIDVVEGSKSQFEPKVSMGRIVGRGAFDMKGSLSAMICAINSVKTSKKVHLLITSDEETGGHKGARWFFKTTKIVPKIAVIPDGQSLNTIVTKQKGPFHLVVEIKGDSSHGSMPWEGDNPNNKLIKLSEGLMRIDQAKNENEWLPTINITRVKSDTSINQIPDKTTLTLDIRTTNKKQIKLVEKLIEECQGSVKEVFGDGIEVNQDGTSSIKAWETIVSSETNKKVKHTFSPGASDARHLPKKTEKIITQAEGANAHGKNEWVSTKSIDQLVKVTTKFIETL